MTVLWADPFKTYGTDETKLTDGLYVGYSGELTLIDDPDPNADSDSMALRFNDATELRWAVPTGPNDELGMFVRLWMDDLPPNDTSGFCIEFRTNTNAELCKARVLPNGQLRFYRGSTVLGTSTLPILVAGSWNHIECKIVFNDTTGESEFRVNRIEVVGLSLTNQDTMNTSAAGTAAIIALSTGNGALAYIKDFTPWDTNGSLNNDFLGTKALYVLQLDGDASFNWTGTSGVTGYDLINELTPNDANYIYADDSPPAASTFTFENLPPEVVSIAALLTVVRYRNSDGGDGNVQSGIITNGDTDLGADRPGTTAFTYGWDVSEVSADTGVAYTPTEVNNSQFSLDRTL